MKRKRNRSLGCLFWIALILLVLVIFLFNRKRIETVLEATGFIEVLSSGDQRPEVERTNEPPVRVTAPDATDEAEEVLQEEEDQIVSLELSTETVETGDTSTREIEDKRLRRANLYYVFHDGTEGELRRIVRPVYYTDSPLTDTLKALLQGPSVNELNQNLMTLIPRDSHIRSVAVKDGIAYIDVSEAFRFNSFGYEGAVLQLKQLIFTATEFPTVSAVQFLIEGEKQQYLNPEGLYIGKPLGRESL